MSELHIEGFKGTQGKWMIDPHNLGTRWSIESETGVNVAIASQVARRGELTERDANANLIAAAPELLKFLIDLLEIYQYSPTDDEVLYWVENNTATARSLVEKALGE